MALSDVINGDTITSARANEINDKIEQGTAYVNTLSVNIAGTEIIDSSRNIADAETGAHNFGTAVNTVYYGDGSNLSGLGGGGNNFIEAIVDAAGGGDYTKVSDAITAGKKGIFVRNGTYSSEAAWTLSTANTSIIGESREGVVIDYGAAGGSKVTISADNVTITNLTFDDWTDPGTGYVISVNGCDNTLIDRVTMTNLAGGGASAIQMGNTGAVNNAVVSNCYISANFAGLVLSINCTKCKIINTYREDTNVSARGLYCHGQNCLISGCTLVYPNSTHASGGISSEAGTTKECIFVNNYITTTGAKKGINVGAGLGDNTIIANNYLYNATGGSFGIDIGAAGTDKVIIMNNRIDNFGTSISDNGTNTIIDTGDGNTAGDYNNW